MACKKFRLQIIEMISNKLCCLEFSISNFKSQISNFKFQIPNFKFQISNPKFQISNLNEMSEMSVTKQT